MKSKDSGFFWPSFTDLMTSLFFIMLVLYVLTYVKLTVQQRRIEEEKKVTEQQLKKIREIQDAVKELPEQYFAYDTQYKRFSLTQDVRFEKMSDVISQQDETYLVSVGSAINALINTLKTKYAGQDIKYLVVIEGMASMDGYRDNFPLSYKRAWAVLKLWQQYRVVPDQSICEV
jgi:flagellar motor protein MotB